MDCRCIKVLTAVASVGTGIYLFRLRHVFHEIAEAARLSELRRIELERLAKELKIAVDKNADRLAESELQYEVLTSTIPQLVWACLPDGACNYLSQQWEEYTGIAISEQLGLNWAERVMHPHDRDRTLEHWLGAVKGLHDYDIEYRIRRVDGEYRWFQVRGRPLRDQVGAVIRWVGTCTDIQTQKILVEELSEAKLIAERASEAKTHFLANMSHEIRTPVGAIIGFAEMLNDSERSNSEKQKFSNIIERNSKQLLRLIDDILDLSKVEAGKLTFENSDFSLIEFFQDTEALKSLKANEKGIRFALNVTTSVPDYVNGDALRPKQILTNVIGNAIKFTERGTVIAEVSYHDQILKIVVSDTGVGISLDDTGKLFNVFTQADSSFTRKFGGTGLGLTLAKRLATRFSGNLVLDRSEVAKGTQFTITVRLPESAHAKLSYFSTAATGGAPRPELSNLSYGSLAGSKVLLVEDSPDNQTLIATCLKVTGAEVATADNGQEGFERAIADNPDIVLMDIQMPVMDGHQATRKLREAGFRKPIVALTAHAMREERDRCFAAGCSDYLTKPLKREQLIETVQKNLSSVLRDS